MNGPLHPWDGKRFEMESGRDAEVRASRNRFDVPRVARWRAGGGRHDGHGRDR